MTADQFDAAYRAFCRRRPFRTFSVGFMSGIQVSVGHPEAVRSEGLLYLMRGTDGGYVLFAAESVSRLLDLPAAPT